ncbi:Hypothetical_protein [Hexamita inflata]|uniref:Hypothetical_protein n=1 Tax=Hexamita inflata TaxID=28002 RepID=A0AA86QZU5_9EUKA|nr:Hypothetical protein HINF_LOCUS54072 [Hexamita inflata]
MQVSEYQVNRSFIHRPPQILSNNLSIHTQDEHLDGNSFGSQSNVSSIHYINNATNGSKLQSANSSRVDSEVSMNLSSSFDSTNQTLKQKLKESGSALQQIIRLLISLDKSVSVIDKNIQHMDVHLQKLRRFHYNKLLTKEKLKIKQKGK